MGPSGFWPVFIPAGVATRVDVSGLDVPGRLKLDVITGGPAYLWFGREGTTDATRQITPAANGGSINFDLACSAQSDAERDVDAGISTLTLFATVDTVAYVQFTPHDKHHRGR